MKRRTVRASSAPISFLMNILNPQGGINTSFFGDNPDGPADRHNFWARNIFDRVEVFKLSKVNLRTAVAEAPGSDELYVFPVGLGEFNEKYKQEVRRLKEAGKSVLMIEPRGIGLSSNPDMPGTIDVIAAAKDIAELLQTPQFTKIAAGKKVVLGGHSTGGNIAAQLLVNETDLCNRIFCGAVIQSPAIRPNITAGQRKLAETLTKLGLGFVSGGGEKDPAKNPLTNVVEVLKSAQQLQRTGFRRLAPFNMRSRGTAGFAYHLDKAGDAIMAGAPAYSRRGATAKFHGPITFIMGKDDSLISHQAAIDVGEKIGAEIVYLDARHEPHLELGKRLEAYRAAVDNGLARAFAPRTLG